VFWRQLIGFFSSYQDCFQNQNNFAKSAVLAARNRLWLVNSTFSFENSHLWDCSVS
jgi:hypothetical protein